jgi:predicted RNA methylase
VTDVRDPVVPLSAVQRLRLLDALRELWRDQVRRITELSVELHTLDPLSERSSVDLAPHRVSARLVEARLALAEVERALQRLADRTYGRCAGCGSSMAFAFLLAHPARVVCAECGGRGARSVAAAAESTP